MFDAIEDLKREYTDKYVVVDAEQPELARFAGYTGQVKTVNMSGRALVQFEAWNNIGWYDIDLSFLSVVPKPEPGAKVEGHAKPAAKPAAAKPAAGEKKMSAAEMARAQGAAKPAAAAAPPAGTKPSTVAKPATGAQPGKKLSTADILAAARAKKDAATASPAQSSADAPPHEPEVTHEVGPQVPKAEPASKPALGGAKPTTTAEKIAWCRAHDAH